MDDLRFRSLEAYFAYEEAVPGARLAEILGPRLGPASRVVDVGCGLGGSVAALAPRAGFVLGVEADPEYCARGSALLAARGVRARIVRGDAERLPVADGAADAIILQDAIEHMRDPGRVLAEARRALAPRGVLFVSFPPGLSPFAGHLHQPNNPLRFLPYAHLLLPRRWVVAAIRRARPFGFVDARRIEETFVGLNGLTLAGFRRIAREAGFRAVSEEAFVIRPAFRRRFGLPEIRLPRGGRLGAIAEFLCLGYDALLTNSEAA